MADGFLLKAARDRDQVGCRIWQRRPPVVARGCWQRRKPPMRSVSVASCRVGADRLEAKTERMSQAVTDFCEAARLSRDHGGVDLRTRRLSGFAARRRHGIEPAREASCSRRASCEQAKGRHGLRESSSVMALGSAALVVARLERVRRMRARWVVSTGRLEGRSRSRSRGPTAVEVAVSMATEGACLSSS